MWLSTPPSPPCYFLSDDILHSFDDEHHEGSHTCYAKEREIELKCPGSVLRIQFSGVAFAACHGYFRIYRNGAAVGTQRSASGGYWGTWTEDIPGWSHGDLLQLYTRSSVVGCDIWTKNLRVLGVLCFGNQPI